MRDNSITIGIIGCGRWGINHVRTAFGLLTDRNMMVFDSSEAARARVASISPSIPFTTRKEDILDNPGIDAVIIATPAETHYSVARECLQRGKHVLVEKPITLDSAEARELVAMAREMGRKLMVGHVLLYHPAITAMKRMIDDGVIGSMQYLYSNRLNLGALRSEENVLWSFAPHDISIIQHFTGSRPSSVTSRGASFLQKSIEDTTMTYLTYPGNIHAHIFVSWLHPFKEHRLVVIGDKGMLVFEDSLPNEKLKMYHKGFQRKGERFEKFDDAGKAIPVADLQPLAEEHKHFYSCIVNGTTPLTDGVHAVEVLEILELATKGLLHE